MRDVEAFVRNQIRRILLEDAPTPSPAGQSATPAAGRDEGSVQGPRVIRGRIGGGKFSNAIVNVKSRADTPEGAQKLIKDLGISGPTGRTQIEKVLSIVKQATSKADVMRDAYGDAKILQDEAGAQFIQVKHNSELTPRNAAQYMYIMFQAAEKAGKLAGIKGEVIPGLVKTGDGDVVAIILK